MVLSRAFNLPRLQVLCPRLTPLTHRFHRGVFGGRNASTGIGIFLWFMVSKGKDDWAIAKHSQKRSSLCSTLGCHVSLQNGEISFNPEKSWFLIPCRKLTCQTVALYRKPKPPQIAKDLMLGSIPCLSPPRGKRISNKEEISYRNTLLLSLGLC